MGKNLLIVNIFTEVGAYGVPDFPSPRGRQRIQCDNRLRPFQPLGVRQKYGKDGVEIGVDGRP
jgi:hypothetical protein